MSNTWPCGEKHAMHQSEHESWNAKHYPGTCQLCVICEQPTGRCEDDDILTSYGEPICENCHDEMKTNEEV